MADIYRIFTEYIRKNSLISEGDHLIAGVSGGADSMCLLVLLDKLSKEIPFKITVVHVHHQLRGEEADADEAFVKDFCREKSLKCIAVKAAVRQYAEEHGLSLEEAGRTARYQTFYQVARKLSGEDTIPEQFKAAVAHHMDDNAETILMNLVRGTGLKGMQGMQPVAKRFGITVIRPLLCLSRKQIEEYLESEGVGFRTDSSNNEDEFSRNKFRLNIIPQLNEINSSASAHINEAACDIVRAQEFIEREAQKALELMADRRDDGWYIDLNRFRVLDVTVKGQLIRDLVEKMSGSLKDVGRVHIDSVVELENKQTGRRVELPYDLTAVRSYGNIILRKVTRADRLARDMTDYASGNEAEKLLPVPEEAEEPSVPAVEEPEPEAFAIDPLSLSMEPTRYQLWKGMEIELTLVHVNPVTRQYLTADNQYTKAFDCAKIKGNLILQKPHPHDEIQFFGGRKTVRKFFVDEKIPQEYRQNVIALKDEEQIMWLIGYRMSESFKITDMTNLALRVSIISEQHEI